MAIQSEPKDNPTFNTIRCTFPSIWNIVIKLLKEWKELGWYKPNNPGSNPTNLKEKIVENITKTRKMTKRDNIPSYIIDLVIKQQGSTALKTHYQWYCMDVFLLWSESQYKTNLLEASQKDKPTVNDIIRLFSIATAENNRDIITSMGYGKAFKRSELDANMSIFDSAMTKWAIEFNNSSYYFRTPGRASYLSSFHKMDPNDPARISIERDYIWIGRVYKKVLTEYNVAYRRWTKGTGGGSGAEENFENWETREKLENFANYATNGSVDYLAYLLMLDKKANYVINTINDEAPAHTVTEDGNSAGNSGNIARTPKKKRKTAMEQVASTAKEIQEDMKGILQESMKLLGSKNEANSNAQQTQEVATMELQHKSVDGMTKCYNLICSLETQLDKMKTGAEENDSDDNESSRKTKRMELLEKALSAAYEKLENFSA